MVLNSAVGYREASLVLCARPLLAIGISELNEACLTY